MGATEAVVRLQRIIAADLEAAGDREDLMDSWDLCVCGDARKDHRERIGGCWVCRGHFDPSTHCTEFVNA